MFGFPRFSRLAVSVALLAVVLCGAIASIASAFPALGNAVPLPVRRARAATAFSAWEDSTSFWVGTLTTSIVSDTLKTIDLGNVNWHGAAAGSASSYTVGALHFTVASPGGGDSLSVRYQCSVDGTIWGPQTSTIITCTGTAGDAYYRIPIIVTPATISNVSPFLVPYLRVIVYGDTGGSFGGVKAYWTPLVESGVPTK